MGEGHYSGSDGKKRSGWGGRGEWWGNTIVARVAGARAWGQQLSMKEEESPGASSNNEGSQDQGSERAVTPWEVMAEHLRRPGWRDGEWVINETCAEKRRGQGSGCQPKHSPRSWVGLHSALNFPQERTATGYARQLVFVTPNPRLSVSTPSIPLCLPHPKLVKMSGPFCHQTRPPDCPRPPEHTHSHTLTHSGLQTCG